MRPKTPEEFVSDFAKVRLPERSSCQSHFIALCHLLGEAPPVEADPTGEWFTFEKGVKKSGGGQGYADVWRKDCFGWEYKRKDRHKTLAAAYNQLLTYREALDNPPLLIVCDIERIEIHTNFTGKPSHVQTIGLSDFLLPGALSVLRRAFRDPYSFEPGTSKEDVTADVARRFCRLADGLRVRRIDPERSAHFLVKLMFCMFAEDIGLLDEQVFRKAVRASAGDPEQMSDMLRELFGKMATGGRFGTVRIKKFNGGLFADAEAIDLTAGEIADLLRCAECDWSAVEPSVFGTLFERTLDPDKRGQLGAHYTHRDDIEMLLRPVFLDPLEREWDAARVRFDELYAQLQDKNREYAGRDDRRPVKRAREGFEAEVRKFFRRLTEVTVLDPACGSGNFLYVALRMLLDLEKKVWVYAASRDVTYTPLVDPSQFQGLEVNSYARELAQIVIWIGFLQWKTDNPIRESTEPILKPGTNVTQVDAILGWPDPVALAEPEWPNAEFIVGNPPFLGGKLLRSNLGDDYVDALFRAWGGRVGLQADLCCYWFEKARAMIQAGRSRRAGLIATQGIRGGKNRQVLNRIKESGDIFFAVSDRDWVQGSANVHISMVGFDNGAEINRLLDGRTVRTINPNLTATADVTRAKRLPENLGIGFMGDTKGGPFDIPLVEARRLLEAPNVNGRPSSDVVVPWCNGLDVTRRNRDVWIIDYPLGTSRDEAEQYDAVFDFLKPLAEAARAGSRSKVKDWWHHERPRVDMRQALAPLGRFLATPNVTKHRLFVWMAVPTLADHQLIAYGYSDDYLFGVLHSRVHEVWARSQGTQMRERESGFRYTPTTCFETFPMPEPFAAHEAAIGAAANKLDTLRNTWLNPPEWTRTEHLEFPGSAGGPWARYVQDADPVTGIGTVRYPRVVARNPECAAKLKKRTLTALYNQSPEWLKAVHRELDELVLAAYGWKADIGDDDLLSRLLDLNLSRANEATAVKPRATLPPASVIKG